MRRYAPGATPIQRLNALANGALLVAYWGAGPVSLDERAERPVQAASAARVVAA